MVTGALIDQLEEAGDSVEQEPETTTSDNVVDNDNNGNNDSNASEQQQRQQQQRQKQKQKQKQQQQQHHHHHHQQQQQRGGWYLSGEKEAVKTYGCGAGEPDTKNHVLVEHHVQRKRCSSVSNEARHNMRERQTRPNRKHASKARIDYHGTHI